MRGTQNQGFGLGAELETISAASKSSVSGQSLTPNHQLQQKAKPETAQYGIAAEIATQSTPSWSNMNADAKTPSGEQLYGLAAEMKPTIDNVDAASTQSRAVQRSQHASGLPLDTRAESEQQRPRESNHTTTEFRPLSAAHRQLSATLPVSPLAAQRSVSRSPSQAGAVVDIKVAAAKLLDNMTPKHHLYLQSLSTFTAEGVFPENARPSLLQTKLNRGCNTLVSVLQPVWSADGLDCAEFSDASTPQPTTALRQWQFSFALVGAKNVGPTGLLKRRPTASHTARVCVLDKSSSQFLGNIWTIPATEVRSNESTWAFDPTDFCIVRCSRSQKDHLGGIRELDAAEVSLFVELNITYKLTADDMAVDGLDIKSEPTSKVSKLVNEISTCWALVSLSRCADMTREVEVAVPLYSSDLNEPVPLDQLILRERQKHPIKSLFKPAKPATLIFRVGPTPIFPPPILPFGLMPSSLVVTPDLGMALAAYRAAILQSVATHGELPVPDAALANFPKILEDSQLMQQFLLKWVAYTNQHFGAVKGGLCCNNKSEAPPAVDQVVALWRRLCLEVGPLLYSQAVPLPHISNFTEFQVHRRNKLNNFLFVVDAGGKTVKPRQPVDPLSHASSSWLHKPFDVRETKFALK